MLWRVFVPPLAPGETEAHRRGGKWGREEVSHTGLARGGGRFWVHSSQRGAAVPRETQAGADPRWGPAKRSVPSAQAGAEPGRSFPALGPPIRACRGSALLGAAIRLHVGVGVVGRRNVWRPQLGHLGRGRRPGWGRGRGIRSSHARLPPESEPLKWRR